MIRTKLFSAAAAALTMAAVSCESLLGPTTNAQGALEISFQDDIFRTKASGGGSIPDTNNFILSVTNSSGTSIYYGLYSAAPQTLLVSPGTYTITAKSCEFSSPQFDCPQYGDTQVATVKSSETSHVELNCSMINSGIRLVIDSDFLADCSDGVLYLKAKSGRVMYSFAEKRIAYFLPGSVSLVLVRDTKETTLFTRILEEQQILTVSLSSAQGSAETSGGIHINIDTTKTYLSDSFVYGDDASSKGKSKADALSVSAARSCAPLNEVWVYGYIVGGDLSSSKCSFTAPFSSRTNIVLATKTSCTSKDLCLSVQLSSGDVRDDLNLVDNPELLGKKVFLHGDLVSAYYGIPGMQCIDEYEVD